MKILEVPKKSRKYQKNSGNTKKILGARKEILGIHYENKADTSKIRFRFIENKYSFFGLVFWI